MKLKQAYETEIFPTEGGYVAIKQPDPMRGDDSMVLLSAHQLADVISELQSLLDDRTSWENEESNGPPTPLKIVGGSESPR